MKKVLLASAMVLAAIGYASAGQDYPPQMPHGYKPPPKPAPTPRSIGLDGANLHPPMAVQGLGGSSSSSAVSGGSYSAGMGFSGSTSTGTYSGGNTTINDNQAPAIGLPSIGGGGNDCPVVGFGVGGSGLGGGGGFGPSWISSRCDHRKYAELIAELSGKQAALAYLCRVESDTCAAVTPVVAPVTWVKPDYCQRPGWTADQIARRYPECHG